MTDSLIKDAPYLLRNSQHLKASTQLGMPITRATGRLTRRLLFYMAQRLGMDVCFQCKEPILSVESFSIEHKQPWLDVSPNLFWDLSNVAFSHKRCNSSSARRNKIHCPDGMGWCYECGGFKPIGEFSRNKAMSNGYVRCCKYHTSLKKKSHWKTRERKTYTCIEADCANSVCREGSRCRKCARKQKPIRKGYKIDWPSRGELTTMLKTKSKSEIAARLGVSRTSVSNYLK